MSAFFLSISFATIRPGNSYTQSELWRLRWEDVHLDGDRPRFYVYGSKSEGAERDVPLLPPVINILREWRDRDGVSRAMGLVWPSASGGQHNEDFDACWADKRYTSKKTGEIKVTPGSKTRAGITRRVRFHDLRHTFCSHLVQGTWGRAFTLQEVRDLAGHSDISVTQRYAHLAPGGVHEMFANMAQTMAEKH